MYKSVTINISEEVYNALLHFSAMELRNPQKQVVWIIQQELERRGFLTSAETISTPPTSTLDYFQKGVTIVQ